MSQTKAQLLAPIGVVTAPGLTVTGVLTTTSAFDGPVTGTANSIVQGSNIIVGVMTAAGFAGDFTGTATGIKTTSNLNVGVVTALSFVGDVTGNLTGSAGGLSGTPNVHVGVVTSSAMSGDGSNLSGIAATAFTAQTVPDNITYAIDVTSPAGGNYTLSGTDRNGSVSGSDPTVTVEVGDTLNFVVDASGHPFYIRVSDGGANVSTPAATNQGAQSGTVSWTPNTAGTYYYQCGNHAGMIGTITVTATTTIDVSAGNNIVFNLTSNTTVSFANTGTTEVISITFPNATGSVTWPSSVRWNGGAAPNLISSTFTNDWNVVKLLTRDSGLSWKGWEESSFNGSYYAYVTGSNTYGALGQNNTVNYSSPVLLGAGYKGMISNGNFQYGTSYTKTDRTLWGAGANYFGMLGLNQPHTTKISSPTQVGTDKTWDKVSYQWKHKYGIKTDGTLWAWGLNDYGSLGLNEAHAVAHSSPVQLPGINWKSAGGAYYNTAAIKTDGTLWTWGLNYGGGLGLNQGYTPTFQGISSPTQLPGTDWLHTAGAYYEHMAVDSGGGLWTWGSNAYGQLGQNSTDARSSPVQIYSGFSATPWSGWSQTDNSMIGTVEGGYMALKADGTMWSWGNSKYGENGLNQGGTVRYSSPVQVGTVSPTLYWTHLMNSGWTTVFGIKNDNTLWRWGWGGEGQGGVTNDRTHYSSPTQIPGDWYMKDGQICADAYATLWRKAD